MKKLIVALIIIGGLIVALLYGVVLIKGPRMTVQPHFRAFQISLPNLPSETVTVSAPTKLPAPAQAAKMFNPLRATSDNLKRGKIYYHYYCVFCHGETGDGHGPVGQSYVPPPADLRSTRVLKLEDGELLRAMLTGMGHEPVLERVVPPQHRWYVALYVRSLP